MSLLLAYSLRNLWVRRVTTVATVTSLGLVVFVFTAVLMLAHGLETALVETGSESNAIVLRKGANTEVASGLYRDQAQILSTLQGIGPDSNGRPVVVPELVVLVNLRKHGASSPATVILRGTAPTALTVRPSVRLIAGRSWQPGTNEIIVGVPIARQFQQAALGGRLRIGARDWTVVGLFAAGGSAFESEIWGDASQLMAVYSRESFSSATLRLAQPTAMDTLRTTLEQDPRLSLQIKRERDYYSEKSGMMAGFIRLLGLAFTIIFSCGAMLGAMITMYGAVANRTGELGTLRTLGFGPPHILSAVLVESLAMAAVGWLLGTTAASLLQLTSVTTQNWATMSQLAFGFSLSLPIASQGLLFALAMGVAGGMLPAWRASRLSIRTALAERAG